MPWFRQNWRVVAAVIVVAIVIVVAGGIILDNRRPRDTTRGNFEPDDKASQRAACRQTVPLRLDDGKDRARIMNAFRSSKRRRDRKPDDYLALWV